MVCPWVSIVNVWLLWIWLRTDGRRAEVVGGLTVGGDCVGFINKRVVEGTVVWCFVGGWLLKHLIGCWDWKLRVVWLRNRPQVVHRLKIWPAIKSSFSNTIYFFLYFQTFASFNATITPLLRLLTVTRTCPSCQQQQQNVEIYPTVGLYQCNFFFISEMPSDL